MPINKGINLEKTGFLKKQANSLCAQNKIRMLRKKQRSIFPLANHKTMGFAAFKFHQFFQMYIKFSKDLGNQEPLCDYFDSS